MLNRTTILCIAVFAPLALSLTGCDNEPAEKAAPGIKEAPTAAPPTGTTGTRAASNGPKVTVAVDGTKFDPTVQKDRLPDGVWYCDMKTIHYASQSEGDGSCPYCGMKLKKFDAAAYTKEVAEHNHAQGDHGHAHGEKNHAHGEHGENDHDHPHDEHGHKHGEGSDHDHPH